MKKLSLKDASEAHKAIITSQDNSISKLYEQWADELAKQAKKYKNKSTASAPLKSQQITQLEGVLRKLSEQTANAANKSIKDGMVKAAQNAIADNTELLKSIGFPTDGITAAFNSVPDAIVQRLVTGQIYEGGWNLSKSIWSDNEDTLKKAYEVVAGGIAQNKSVYDISKDLEQFVSPSARKPWNFTFESVDKVTGEKKTYHVYPKKVDYNAQRLSRTLSQHAYQQAMISVNKDNPFVQKFRWHATGSRACPICQKRDGKLFGKNNVPMDHPNGMCVLEPVYDSNTNKRLADWVKGKDDPALDNYARLFSGGDKPGQTTEQAFNEQQKKYLEKYGFSPDNMPKDFTAWMDKLDFNDASEILKSMGTSWSDPHPTQQLQKFFDDNLATLNVGFKKAVASNNKEVEKILGLDIKSGSDFAAKYGTSSGSKFNYWYTKLDPDAKAIATKLKNESGQTWQQWYESNIYKPKPGSAAKATKPKSQQKPKDTSVSGWLKKAAGQTEDHMLETEDDNFIKMTQDQVDGLVVYTGSAYENINSYLRYRAAGKNEEDARMLSGISDFEFNSMVRAMDGLKKVATKEEFILRRGTDMGDLAGLMGGNFQDNMKTLSGKTVDELNTMFSGHIGTYAGFTSTSSIYDRGFDGGVEVIIRAPVGTQGSSVMSISEYGTGEGEFLLNAGTRVRVIKIEKSDGHMDSYIRVYMEVLVNK